MSKEDQLYLSASRIKTYLSCSFKYWANYKLKAPSSGNFGSARGGVVHDVFELLLDPKYKEWYDWIMEYKTCKGIPELEKTIQDLRTKYGVLEEADNKGVHNGELIDEMIYNGCVYDFFCDGWELQPPEEGFDFINESPYYALRGFIDKHARKELKGLIRDYKSSSKIDEGDHELQGMLYALYLLKKKQVQSKVEFQFLRFPDNPIVSFSFDDDELLGLEEWLKGIQLTLENFDEEDAYSNFAANQDYPTDGSFGGPLMCGYSKYPDHRYPDNHKDVAKRGKPYFSCEYKWPFKYYALTRGGKVFETALDKKELKKKKGYKIEGIEYKGCPKFNPQNYS